MSAERRHANTDRFRATAVALAVLPKVVAKIRIGSNIESEDENENVKEKKFEEQLFLKRGLLPYIKTVIRWNNDGRY